MNAKKLAILLVVAAVAIGTAVWTTQQPPQEAQMATERHLLPKLEQGLNEITRLQLTKGGEQLVVELIPGEQGWVAVNKHGYPAAMDKLRETLLKLAASEIVEQKTGNPEFYSRLGVEDIASTDAQGVQLVIEGPQEKPIRLIIGKEATTGSGTYVRRTDESNSWLINKALQLDTDSKTWLDQTILNIPATEVQSIRITQPDGAVLLVSKSERGQADFAVADIPQGRSLSSPYAANTLAGALANLQLDDVVPLAELNPDEHNPADVEYRLFDGRIITAKLFQADDKHYAHFSVRFDQQQAEAFAPEAKTEEDSGDKKAAEASDEKPDFDKLAEQAKELDQRRLNPWVYQLSSWKYDNMVKRQEDLLAPVESAEDAEAVPEDTGEDADMQN